MRALITGCDGFVGRNFTRYLKSIDWEVFGLDIATDPSEDAFKYFVDGYDDWFDLIVHAAYEVGGRSHIDGKNMALAKNVSMDAAMFQWALESNQGAVLYFSSSAAYPVKYQTKAWVDEEFENGYGDLKRNLLLQEKDINEFSPPPDANYGWAKVTGERVAKASSDQGLRVHIVRPFSGYGGDQSLQYPFPSIIRRVREGDFTVWGPEGQTRDWIHIDDVVRGAFAIYEADERKPVNLCTGIATDMQELVMTIQEALTGDGECDVKYLLDKPTGVYYRVGDPTLMNQYYTHNISIDEGVRLALGNRTKRT